MSWRSHEENIHKIIKTSETPIATCILSIFSCRIAVESVTPNPLNLLTNNN